MRFLRIVLLLCLWGSPICAQQTNSRNYIIKRANKQSGANPDDVSKVTTQVRYFDGLGRPIQTVSVGQSPSGHDFVEPLEYDAAGRVVKQYLPYVTTGNGAFQANAYADAPAWYTTNAAGLKPTDLARPYLQTVFETAPASRIGSQRAPGNNSANSVKKYKVNGANQINRYDYDPAGNTVIQNAQYAAGTLTYVNFTDEQGNVTNEFTDMLGQMVCRQVIAGGGTTLSTYYVYDDLGLLRAVLQPNYQDVASLTDHAFAYDYDERGRMVVKRVPGGGGTEMVYDQYNRLAMSRDANQLARGVWGFVKYDALDRPIAAGEIASAATRQTWAANVDLNTQHHEDRANGTVQGYSLDKTAPKNATVDNLLTITFYDDYGFSKAAYHAYDGYLIPSYNANVKGQVTGGRIRMLPGNGNAGGFLTHANYYDAEYRPIQTVRDLYDLGSGAYERTATAYKYDLAPVAAHEEYVQVLGANQAYVLSRTYTFDHADRLLGVLESVATPQSTKEAYLASYRYNALGSLENKWFYNVKGNKYIIRTDHTYNIRGWLTDASSVYKKTTAGPEFSVFGYGLAYANGASYTNGNISQMQWRNQDEASFTKGLNFTYDGANRLTGSSGIGGYTDTESNITYDKSGNLKTLTRAGSVADNLTYAYTGNRLTSVTDASGSNFGVKNGLSTYLHDNNGNITSDGNRGAVITYNQLNLPKTITVGGKTLTYDYDASGVKHKYFSDTLTIKYAGAFEYRLVGVNNIPYRAALSEGQAVFKNGIPFFEFYLKDHLGNVRVLFDTTGKIKQRTDYYPFGLGIARDVPVQTQAVRNGVNRYTFLNRERQAETGYIDLVRRFYDPTIGRFMQVDPVTETQEHLSLYQYGWNNPILRSDPNGDMPDCCGEWGTVVGQFAKGVGEAVVRNVRAVTVDLPQTLSGLARTSTLAGKVEAAVGVAMLYEQTQSDWNSGDVGTRANIAGNVVGEVGIAVVGSKGLGNLGKAGVVSDIAKVGEVGEIGKISPNVQNILNTISDFKQAGGEVKVNPLKPGQELNMTFQSTDASKLDLRVETHKLSPSVGGNGVTPQRHLNATVTNASGNTVKMKHINGGHKILE
ncbi:MAG: RHS repeat-associated core domain-containing protein [Dyadobacter sp.]|uniref:DUF6443 domain-containing protein n=1 Tax=Dyadobacter sp. TaxID=1914288 RepID=UPI001B15D5D6|nr:DUF6443 domain-containing protein [Dyadobacter sp.]MBO9613212.1 RHS repeat-associated core domain-containing protein [Dyadobacter sp.]